MPVSTTKVIKPQITKWNMLTDIAPAGLAPRINSAANTITTICRLQDPENLRNTCHKPAAAPCNESAASKPGDLFSQNIG